jgi:hypothetical protein
MRLSDLVPGLVIAAGRRTVTETEITEFAARFGPIREMAGGTRSNPNRKMGTDTASGWLICAIAEQLVASTLGSSSLTGGPLYIQRLSWPGSVHSGDDVELQIEILEKHGRAKKQAVQVATRLPTRLRRPRPWSVRVDTCCTRPFEIRNYALSDPGPGQI